MLLNLSLTQTSLLILFIYLFFLFNNLNIPKVSPEDVLFLEKTIIPEFIKRSIAPMQSGKAAGPDSFPADFYKNISDKLVPLLHALHHF